MRLDYENKKLIFFEYKNINDDLKEEIVKEILVEDADYIDYLKEYVKIYARKS